jgi:DNA-binding MarR family transcriptional regulator
MDAKGDDAHRTADPVDAIIAQWNRERPDLDLDSVGVFGRVYRVSAQMGSHIEEICGQFGITRGEYDVLAALRRAGQPHELSPRELATTAMLTTGGMTGRLDRLERAGLVRRSPDPNDRRGLRVTLTGEGLDVVDRAIEVGLEAQRRALERLGAERVALLTDLLRDLLLGVSDAAAASVTSGARNRQRVRPGP